MSQSQQYFSIKHDFQVTYQLMPQPSALPTQAEFAALIPPAFKLASQINQIEAQALRPLRTLNESAHELAEFLNLQSKKIDLMMNYVLSLGDQQLQHPGTQFGGSNITFISDGALAQGDLVQLKVFISENNCAVFCIAKVIGTEEHSQGQITQTEIVMIDDEDQEQLVRTSLHVQSCQLKARAEQRNTTPPN